VRSRKYLLLKSSIFFFFLLLLFPSPSSSSSCCCCCSGATVHDEPWPLLRLVSIGPGPETFVLYVSVWLQSLKVSQQLKLFYRVGPSTPRPTPNLEGPGYPFLSGSSRLTCLTWEIYQQLCYRQHNSQYNMTMQAPPLRQSRDTYGVVNKWYNTKMYETVKIGFLERGKLLLFGQAMVFWLYDLLHYTVSHLRRSYLQSMQWGS
jgi:hypothetical protein